MLDLEDWKKKAEAARNEKLTRLDEEKSKIALELASVNEKLDNLGQEKANKLNALKEVWAHLQNQLFEEKNIQQENIRKEEKEEQKRINAGKAQHEAEMQKSCIPKVPIPNVYKISPTNWDKLSRSCLSSKTRNTDYRISKRQTRPD